MVLLFGCTSSTSKKINYVPVDTSHQSGTVQIPRAHIVGVDRNNFLIQRFDYNGNTFILYKDSIIQVR